MDIDPVEQVETQWNGERVYNGVLDVSYVLPFVEILYEGSPTQDGSTNGHV